MAVGSVVLSRGKGHRGGFISLSSEQLREVPSAKCL